MRGVSGGQWAEWVERSDAGLSGPSGDSCLQVVGAGRGPLVKAALSAGVTAGRPLKVYAVEKNPNAVITLRNRAIMDKWDSVTIVAKDMRHWVSQTRRPKRSWSSASYITRESMIPGGP